MAPRGYSAPEIFRCTARCQIARSAILLFQGIPSSLPIREIHFTLEKGGLIERNHNRGARVVSFTPDDVDEIYDIRNALECLSLRRAIANLPLKPLTDIERRLEELEQQQGLKWTQQHAALDVELYNLIVAHSGNRRLMAYVDNISLLIHWLRPVGYRDQENARRAGEQHLTIVRALLRRDPEPAQRLLAEHIETSKRNALEIIFEKGALAKSPAQGSRRDGARL